MNEEEVISIIEDAEKDGRTKLDLSLKRLTSLPPEIEKLTRLEILDLSHNQLSSLPLEICNLLNLKAISLSSNKLTTLPPEIDCLCFENPVYSPGLTAALPLLPLFQTTIHPLMIFQYPSTGIEGQ